MIKKLLFISLFITPTSNLFSMPTPEQIQKDLQILSDIICCTISKEDRIKMLGQEIIKYDEMLDIEKSKIAELTRGPKLDALKLKAYRLLAIIQLLACERFLLAEQTKNALARLEEFYITREKAIILFQTPEIIDFLVTGRIIDLEPTEKEIAQLDPRFWTPFVVETWAIEYTD